MFANADSFNQDLPSWNVSNVTTMNSMFENCDVFNGDLSNWNPSNVTDMSDIFKNALAFNGDISAWDVSKVENMRCMFEGSSFNQDISSWDVSKVTDMTSLFFKTPFNGDISSWDVSSVEGMSNLFRDTPFNGDISSWDVSSVESMNFMFMDSPFNGDLSSWDVSNVTNMTYMFKSSEFNQDLTDWDVSKVTNMRWMFAENSFNGDISSWDVSKVEDMGMMFRYNSSFSGDLSNWDVSSVEDMKEMFNNATSFNSDISSWDVSSVETMNSMFKNCDVFNQDLSSWDVSNVTNMSNVFSNTIGLSDENKCAIQTTWSTNSNWPYDWLGDGFCDDCAGVTYGDSWESECGCVAADNSGDECDDCYGIPFGDGIEDECGVCDGNSSSYAYFDILNIVTLVDAILEDNWSSNNLYCSDIDNSGTLSIVDVIMMVESILGSARLVDASEVILTKDNYSLTYNADGFVGGLQITLSHDDDFDIELTTHAMVADYKTTGSLTTIIVAAPESGPLFTASSEFFIEEVIAGTSAGEIMVTMPVDFGLSTAYPNPFNPSTSFNLNMSSTEMVSIDVYNVMGQRVDTIHNGELAAGVHSFSWNGVKIASGAYFIKATTSSNVATQKVMLMK